jgi:hypothetical protein
VHIERLVTLLRDESKVWRHMLWGQLVVAAHARGGVETVRETAKLYRFADQSDNTPRRMARLAKYEASRALVDVAALVHALPNAWADLFRASTVEAGDDGAALYREFDLERRGEMLHSISVLRRYKDGSKVTLEGTPAQRHAATNPIDLLPSVECDALESLAGQADAATLLFVRADARWNTEAERNLKSAIADQRKLQKPAKSKSPKAAPPKRATQAKSKRSRSARDGRRAKRSGRS